jgi:hypothetical protein
VSLAAWVVFAATPNPQQPFDKSRVEPGWIALIFLVCLGGALAFLWFSLRKHLGRIDVGKHQRDRTPPTPQEGAGPT